MQSNPLILYEREYLDSFFDAPQRIFSLPKVPSSLAYKRGYPENPQDTCLLCSSLYCTPLETSLFFLSFCYLPPNLRIGGSSLDSPSARAFLIGIAHEHRFFSNHRWPSKKQQNSNYNHYIKSAWRWQYYFNFFLNYFLIIRHNYKFDHISI